MRKRNYDNMGTHVDWENKTPEQLEKEDIERAIAYADYLFEMIDPGQKKTIPQQFDRKADLGDVYRQAKEEAWLSGAASSAVITDRCEALYGPALKTLYMYAHMGFYRSIPTNNLMKYEFLGTTLFDKLLSRIRSKHGERAFVETGRDQVEVLLEMENIKVAGNILLPHRIRERIAKLTRTWDEEKQTKKEEDDVVEDENVVEAEKPKESEADLTATRSEKCESTKSSHQSRAKVPMQASQRPSLDSKDVW